MKINAKITKTFKEGNVKAIADLTFDNAIAVHGVKLVSGPNGLFIGMPTNKWQDQDGNYKHVDIVHPTSAEMRSQIFHAVEDAYNTLGQTPAQAQSM